MTHHITNKALALAIGTDKFHIHDYKDKAGKHDIKCLVGDDWESFDYRQHDVIWPIAVQFNCFPWCDGLGDWWASVEGGKEVSADTPELAVALAVIGSAKK
jgi:hypothetical protein